MERARQRDPLKLGIFVLSGIIALFVAFYFWELASAQGKLSRADDLRAQWEKKQKEYQAVSKLEAELKATATTALSLKYRIENRFYWAPILEILYKSVTPAVQIINFQGLNQRPADGVTIALEGLAAGTQPRATAEEFRKSLLTALSEQYKGVEVNFRGTASLEETGVTVRLGAKDMPTAKFLLDVKMKKPFPPVPPAPTPPPVRPKK